MQIHRLHDTNSGFLVLLSDYLMSVGIKKYVYFQGLQGILNENSRQTANKENCLLIERESESILYPTYNKQPMLSIVQQFTVNPTVLSLWSGTIELQ